MIFAQEQTHINFKINTTCVIRPIKQNQLSFNSIKINKPLPASVQCQVQMPVLVVPLDQMPDHT